MSDRAMSDPEPLGPPGSLMSLKSSKTLDRVAEDLESAAVRHGFTVVAIHDLDPGFPDRRVYEVCHREGTREILSRCPKAAILTPCRVLLTGSAKGTLLTAVRPGAALAGFFELSEISIQLEERIGKVLAEAARGTR